MENRAQAFQKGSLVGCLKNDPRLRIVFQESNTPGDEGSPFEAAKLQDPALQNRISALHYAASHGSTEVVILLLSMRAIVNQAT